MVSAEVRKLFISVFFWQQCVDFMVLPLKITSVKYTYPGQRPKFSSLYHHFLLEIVIYGPSLR